MLLRGGKLFPVLIGGVALRKHVRRATSRHQKQQHDRHYDDQQLLALDGLLFGFSSGRHVPTFLLGQRGHERLHEVSAVHRNHY